MTSTVPFIWVTTSNVQYVFPENSLEGSTTRYYYLVGLLRGETDYFPLRGTLVSNTCATVTSSERRLEHGPMHLLKCVGTLRWSHF